MEDLFEREQKILEHAVAYLDTVEREEHCDVAEYAAVVKAYRMLLKQLRRITKLSDRTAVNLNTSKRDLQDKVHIDELTGIYNRRFFEESMGKLADELARFDNALGVLMMDVDFFKRYNDTYGHAVGDDCLRAVAGAMKESVQRPEEFVARYGGEEFVAVMPGVDEEAVRSLAQRILNQIRALEIPHAHNDAAAYVTISIGASSGVVTKERGPAAFLAAADKALYRSKHDGRNRYTYVNLEETSYDV